MSGTEWLDPDISWTLLYTKPHAEAWAELNLRNQGFVSLLPRVASRSGFLPLFPRYLFVGHRTSEPPAAIRSTFGVLYVVHCGDRPARVPADVIAEIQSRMNDAGVVSLEPTPKRDPLFAKRERDRVRALVKFAQAGFRVRTA